METTNNKFKKFYWLKLKDNFFDREEIQLIESLPNSKEYVLTLLKFMMKAINSEGRLVVKDVIPYNPQMLTTVTHSNVDTVRSTIDIYYFEETNNPNIFWVDISKLDLAPGAAIKKLPLSGGEVYAGEASKATPFVAPQTAAR